MAIDIRTIIQGGLPTGPQGLSGFSGFSGVSGFSGIAAVGGTNTQIQYNNAGSLAGVPSLTYDGSNILIRDYGLVISALGSISGNNTINLNNGNFITATVTGSITWTFSNPPAAAAAGFILELTNGGSATQIWPSPNVKWPGGVAPTLTVSGVDILTFVTDDNGTTWRGVASMLDSK